MPASEPRPGHPRQGSLPWERSDPSKLKTPANGNAVNLSAVSASLMTTQTPPMFAAIRPPRSAAAAALQATVRAASGSVATDDDSQDGTPRSGPSQSRSSGSGGGSLEPPPTAGADAAPEPDSAEDEPVATPRNAKASKGAKASRRATPPPLSFHIDAAAQGFSSANGSPTDSPAVSLQPPGPGTGPRPVEVYARLTPTSSSASSSSRPAAAANSNGNTNGSQHHPGAAPPISEQVCFDDSEYYVQYAQQYNAAAAAAAGEYVGNGYTPHLGSPPTSAPGVPIAGAQGYAYHPGVPVYSGYPSPPHASIQGAAFYPGQPHHAGQHGGGYMVQYSGYHPMVPLQQQYHQQYHQQYYQRYAHLPHHQHPQQRHRTRRGGRGHERQVHDAQTYHDLQAYHGQPAYGSPPGPHAHHGGGGNGAYDDYQQQYQAQYHAMLAHMQGYGLQAAAAAGRAPAGRHSPNGGLRGGGRGGRAASRPRAGLSGDEEDAPSSPRAAAFHRAQTEAAAMPAVPEDGHASAKLDEFRARAGEQPLWTLESISGHVIAFACDQHGSRFVQGALGSAPPEAVAAAFEELRPRLPELMTDVFGNYVVQKLLEVGGAPVAEAVAAALSGRVLPLSLHVYGCRVVQKALEVSEFPAQVALCAELEPFTLRCVRDQNANHVVQKALECVQPSDGIAGIADTVAARAVALSTHAFGCRLVQRLLEHCSIDGLREGAVRAVLACALDLAHDQYGNYVVQHLVAKGPPAASEAIYANVIRLAPSLARHKYASNVVEACLTHGSPHQRTALLDALLMLSGPSSSSAAGVHAQQPGAAGAGDGADGDGGVVLGPTAAAQAAALARDQYGNYVLQRALEVAGEAQRGALLRALCPLADALRRSTYGKHIAARVARMHAAQQEALAQPETEGAVGGPAAVFDADDGGSAA